MRNTGQPASASWLRGLRNIAEYTAQRPNGKKRRGDASPAPFCCPSTKEMDFDLCGGIYPKGARHNGLLCGRKPDSGASSNAHKTPLCWIPPHTTTGAADSALPERCGGAARSGCHCTSQQRTASPWRGLFREGRSGEVAAATERSHLATELKQRADSPPSALSQTPMH